MGIGRRNKTESKLLELPTLKSLNVRWMELEVGTSSMIATCCRLSIIIDDLGRVDQRWSSCVRARGLGCKGCAERER